ncbi:MAG: hypothetical protein P8Y23_15180, partial [Candidatus Lokiarchaeota archaeon]
MYELYGTFELVRRHLAKLGIKVTRSGMGYAIKKRIFGDDMDVYHQWMISFSQYYSGDEFRSSLVGLYSHDILEDIIIRYLNEQG